MPRLCCRKGKRPKRFQTPPIQSEFVSASDWINRSDHNNPHNHTDNNNNSHNNTNTMDLHVNSTQPCQPQQQQQPSSSSHLQHQTTTIGSTTSTQKRLLLRQIQPPLFLSPENVASVPPPGLSAPSQPIFLTIPMTNTNNNCMEQHRIVLSYVAVQPKKVAYPSSKTHKSRTTSIPGGGIRSLYRPLTTSTTTTTTATSTIPTATTTTTTTTTGTTSSNNLQQQQLSNHNSNNTNVQQQPANSSTTTTNNTATSSSTTTTHNNNNNNNNNNNQSSCSIPTERVLMCYDLTLPYSTTTTTTTTTTGINNHNTNTSSRDATSSSMSNNNDISQQQQQQQQQSSQLSSPQQQQQQSVPLLRWQSNLSSLLGRTKNNHSNTTSSTPATATTTTTTTTTTSNSNLTNHKRRGLITENTNSIISTSNSSGSYSSSSNSTISNHTMTESTGTMAAAAAAAVAPTTNIPLDERLIRERMKVGPGSGGSLTQFHWANVTTTIASTNTTTTSKVSNDRNDVDEISDYHNDNNNNDHHHHHTVASRSHMRLLIPARGNLYIQDGVDTNNSKNSDSQLSTNNNGIDTIRCICIHDKSITGMSATDAQLSPDGSMVAWTNEGEIYVQSATPRTFDATLLPNIDTAAFILDDSFLAAATSTTTPAIRISFGASQTESCCITHGVADFVAQEEMDRYRGFWWHPNSKAILFTRTDESEVPIYRIMHQSNSSTLPSFSSSQQHTDHSSSQHYESNSSCNGLFATPKNTNNSAFEDHRYPFAGKMNPLVKLGLVQIDRDSVLELANTTRSVLSSNMSSSDCLERRDGVDGDETSGFDNDCTVFDDAENDPMNINTSQDIAADNWSSCIYFDAPRDVDEYLARVHIVPDGRAIVQWQNRSQTCSILYLLDLNHPTVMDATTGNARGQILLTERSDVWINLHHMFYLLPRPIHPNECKHYDGSGIAREHVPTMPNPLPSGSMSFIFASEKTGYAHLYLYTFCPGVNNDGAVLIRSLTSGKWTVENILGVDLEKDVVYFAGTYDSVLERHLYSIPLLNVRNSHTWRLGSYPTTVPPLTNEIPTSEGNTSQSSLNLQSATSEETVRQIVSNGGVRGGISKVMHALSGKVNNGATGNNTNHVEHSEIFFAPRPESTVQSPTRLTLESGMHSIVIDENCRYFVATSSDVDRPTTVKVYELPTADHMTVRLRTTIYNAAQDDTFASSSNVTNEYKTDGFPDMVKCLPAPELISFPTSDGTETLHAALYRPNPQLYGSGPYPLVCAVYGGPHVQRVNRSWSQSADMRAQRLRSLGFCVVKCDNRGSSRRGLSFESAISRRLGRLEVLDQVAAVRQLVIRGIVDPRRVGVYGWSYGGYLSAMCLCRAPDVFHVAVAGAPVTSWDGYDTHYTERYMGLPTDNPSGYRESAVFDHVPNMRGKLMIVHGLIDENVHFRHTTRLINKLIAAGKDYDLLIFPEERHSPRRLRDRVYMEQRISEYFLRLLSFKDESDVPTVDTSVASLESNSAQGLRPMAGHL